MRLVLPRLAVAVSVAILAVPVRAQDVNTYPGVIACDAAADGRGPVRLPVTVSIAGSVLAPGVAVTYEAGGERGGGTLGEEGRVVLTGRGRGYAARYTGQLGGRGGLLTGVQGAGRTARACQMSLGNGRG